MRILQPVSIDDFGPRFEYLKKLAVWDEVSKLNLQKFKRMAQESWNEETGIWHYSTIIDVTVSIFNILNVGKIADEFARLGQPTHRYESFCYRWVE